MGQKESILGVILSDKDLEAIKRLYEARWCADIRNWKEREVEDCMWIVQCPDRTNNIITELGFPLHKVIDRLLDKVFHDSKEKVRTK